MSVCLREIMEIPVHDVVNTGTELFREGAQGFINVCLARESASQPWGFRLQGGKDRGLPFQLLKVGLWQSAGQPLMCMIRFLWTASPVTQAASLEIISLRLRTRTCLTSDTRRPKT